MQSADTEAYSLRSRAASNRNARNQAPAQTLQTYCLCGHGYNLNRFNGSPGSDTNPRINSGSVGVVLNVPIYTRGGRFIVGAGTARAQKRSTLFESARRIASMQRATLYTALPTLGLRRNSTRIGCKYRARTQL